MKEKNLTIPLPLLVFLIAFFILPIQHLNGFTLMPGNIGDARLNNYFLENIYQFLIGNSESLWHLPFFHPFPYVLGFSDNLFGSSPFYLLARIITQESDTAFQLWFYFGYALNFSASYYALRKLGGSQIAATIGALLFTFSLPTSAHAGHMQLHYRFGIPLAVIFFLNFLEKKNWHLLVISAIWLTWQFYCGIYMGFFTLLMLILLASIYIIYTSIKNKTTPLKIIIELMLSWKKQSNKIIISIIFILLLILLILLFYPYLQASHLYSAKRSWAEIQLMLPRPQSYFIADDSSIWSFKNTNIFSDIPMRHEHQMFIGLIPLLLALVGLVIGIKRNLNQLFFILMTGTLITMITLTLYIGGFSLWYLFHKFPLASAIRAMTRIDQVLLFPIAYLASISIDWIREKTNWSSIITWLFITPLMIFEFSATQMIVSPKKEWRQRLAETEQQLPQQLPEDAIIFFSQNQKPFFAKELDAMWVTLDKGLKTLNGYSGLWPPGYSTEYFDDCTELPRRILAYTAFQNEGLHSYHDLMRRTIPLGFYGCDPSWSKLPPAISTTERVYSQDEIRQLSYQFLEKGYRHEKATVRIRILNSGNYPIAPNSKHNKPVRISWRFLEKDQKPSTGWELRKDLPFDIPAHGSIVMQIPINSEIEIKGGFLQISLVQEGEFWAHDIGISPLTIPWE